MSIKNYWKPNFRKILSGREVFSHALFPGLNGEVTWSVREVALGKFPLHYLECEMNGFGISSRGYGEGWLYSTAVKKAFSEAFERLIMIYASKNPNLLEKLTCNPIHVFSSNGFAAGISDSDAKTRACHELIERHVVKQAWASQRGWTKIAVMDPISFLFFSYLEVNGWQMDLFLLNVVGLDPNNFVLAVLGRNDRYGAVFDSKTHLGPYRFISVWKLLLSLMRSIALRSKLAIGDNWVLKERAKPIDHTLFFSRPSNLVAFEFLRQNESKHGLVVSNLDKIQSFILVPLTSPTQTFPPVAFAVNLEWPQLTWGAGSVSGLNLWPHPIG